MFYPAMKLVVITETFLCEKICAIIEEYGAKGYTLIPVGGKGLHHIHPTSEKATVAEEFTNIKIEVLCRERATAEQIGEHLMEKCFQEYPGVVHLENVEISRKHRF